MNITVSVRQSSPSLCPRCKARTAAIPVHTSEGLGWGLLAHHTQKQLSALWLNGRKHSPENEDVLWYSAARLSPTSTEIPSLWQACYGHLVIKVSTYKLPQEPLGRKNWDECLNLDKKAQHLVIKVDNRLTAGLYLAKHFHACWAWSN